MAIRSLDYNAMRNTLLVGTSLNSLIEIDVGALKIGGKNP